MRRAFLFPAPLHPAAYAAPEKHRYLRCRHASASAERPRFFSQFSQERSAYLGDHQPGEMPVDLTLQRRTVGTTWFKHRAGGLLHDILAIQMQLDGDETVRAGAGTRRDLRDLSLLLRQHRENAARRIRSVIETPFGPICSLAVALPRCYRMTISCDANEKRGSVCECGRQSFLA